MRQNERRPVRPIILFVAASAFLVPASRAGEPAAGYPAVDPGPPGGIPSDAIVLFDGKDLAEWQKGQSGRPAHWKVEEGELVATPGGDLTTRRRFGDVQLHLEWKVTPRGNSGVKLHTRYEIQILDSHGKTEKPRSQAGAVYLQHAPLANVCRPPGEWQSYDVVFRAPRFDAAGELARHGRVTVFHNGVLIHDNVKIFGPTNSRIPARPELEKPLLLQYHGAPVRFRNIWVRPLPPRGEE